MATYNEIYSKKANDFVEGTEENDSIAVYGNHSTVNAAGGSDIISVYGGRHDDGIWLEGDESNLIYAGAGNDSIKIVSRGVSVFGDAGNDTINISRNYAVVDGGAGDDVFDLNYRTLNNVTITGGTGKDTIVLHEVGSTEHFLVTDFSSDDVLRMDMRQYSTDSIYDYTRSSHKIWNAQTVNGNVVLSDNVSVKVSGDDTVRVDVEPSVNITLQGVSDISQVANAKYYHYDGYGAPKEYMTFGKLFGVSDSAKVKTPEPATVAPVTESVSSSTETVPTSNSTTETVPTSNSTTTTANTTTTKTVATTEEKTTTTTEETTTTTVENNTPITPTTTSAVGGNTVINNINNYYGDTYNVNDNKGTVVIGSSVEGGVTNNTSIDNSKTIVISGNTYTYNGGDKVINNYKQGEVVQLLSDYQGIDVKGDSFLVNSSSGQLEIENSRDKFIGYSASSTEVVAYSYFGAKAGNIDGRGKSQAEIMIGGDHVDNQIYAGDGGSSLWGGNGGTDNLTGGDGYDEFFYAVGSGNDVIQNAGSNDIVNLLGVSLEQITAVNVSISEVHLNFVDGGHLKVEGNTGVGYKLGNEIYTCNQTTGEWTTK